MEKTSKKLVGGFMVVMLIATIGAVIASATSEDDAGQTTFWERRQMDRSEPFASDLTKEQKAEIQEILSSMKEDEAKPSEIRAAIEEKLEEWGIEPQIPELNEEELDERLDNAIECTEKRLEILQRTKELRELGYSYEETQEIIQGEFGLETPVGEGQGMMFGHDFRYGAHSGPHGFMSGEESDL